MQPRILPVPDDQTAPAARTILEQTKKAVGMVPNLHQTLAHAPAALRAYTDSVKALSAGRLPVALREQIALTSAGINGCSYCASAHTAIGKGVGLDEGELTRNLGAESGDPKAAAALTFVKRLIETRGAVADEELAAVRQAGFTDTEIVEMVAHVGVNLFTNMFNLLAKTTIDFPEVQLSASH